MKRTTPGLDYYDEVAAAFHSRILRLKRRLLQRVELALDAATELSTTSTACGFIPSVVDDETRNGVNLGKGRIRGLVSVARLSGGLYYVDGAALQESTDIHVLQRAARLYWVPANPFHPLELLARSTEDD